MNAFIFYINKIILIDKQMITSSPAMEWKMIQEMDIPLFL